MLHLTLGPLGSAADRRRCSCGVAPAPAPVTVAVLRHSSARPMGSVAEDSSATSAEPVVFRSKLPDIQIPRHLSLQAYCFERLPSVSSRPCLIDGKTGAVPTCVVEKVRAFAAERGVPVVAVDGAFEGCLELGALMDAAEPLDADEEVDPDDVVALPYSSGTTGLPKGVMLTHRDDDDEDGDEEVTEELVEDHDNGGITHVRWNVAKEVNIPA